MGSITVQTAGSFPRQTIIQETALQGGHAAAIGRIIRHLTEMLPEAIALDHKLHDEGDRPPSADFGMGG